MSTEISFTYNVSMSNNNLMFRYNELALKYTSNTLCNFYYIKQNLLFG